MPVKPLIFKGDKPKKKRKHGEISASTSTSLIQTSASFSDPTDLPDPTSNDAESWISISAPSDLAGPVLLVLPTIPPTALAADANGSVFASVLENMVDGDPRTAEPHDVRQVWVVSRVAGQEEGEIGLKGAHGGFLSCDMVGVLGARREARGAEESLVVESAPGDTHDGGNGIGGKKGQWRIRTVASKKQKQGERFLCFTQNKAESEGRKTIKIALRGDGEAGDETTRLIIRMQAQFKPRTKEQEQASQAKEKVTRAELERVVGRKLDDDEVRRLKRAKRNGTYHEEILDVRVKGKHDKFA